MLVTNQWCLESLTVHMEEHGKIHIYIYIYGERERHIETYRSVPLDQQQSCSDYPTIHDYLTIHDYPHIQSCIKRDVPRDL